MTDCLGSWNRPALSPLVLGLLICSCTLFLNRPVAAEDKYMKDMEPSVGETSVPSDQGVPPSDLGVNPSGEYTTPSDQGVPPSDLGVNPSGEYTTPSGEGAPPSGQGANPSGEYTTPSGGGVND